MGTYFKKFNSEQEYEAALENIDTPNVCWVKNGINSVVHYNPWDGSEYVVSASNNPTLYNVIKNIVGVGEHENGITETEALQVKYFTENNTTGTGVVSAFKDNTDLESANELVYFTNVLDCYGLFSGCSNLVSANVYLAGRSQGAFKDCVSLTTITLHFFPNKPVTFIHEMFWKCSNLTGTVDLTGAWSGKLSQKIDMFVRGCTALEKVILPNCKPSSAKSTFSGATSLVEVDLSGFDASNSALSGSSTGFFSNCNSLSKIILTGCDSTAVTFIKSKVSEAGLSQTVTIYDNGNVVSVWNGSTWNDA